MKIFTMEDMIKLVRLSGQGQCTTLKHSLTVGHAIEKRRNMMVRTSVPSRKVVSQQKKLEDLKLDF